METHDVVIVGGGPAGLSAARHLTGLGVKDVLVLEREPEAGGIPRHCGHRGFGWQSHRRFWTGPRFAAALRHDAARLDIRTGTTVFELRTDGILRVRNRQGAADIKGKRVLLATGTRETPRSAQLVGGSRPEGVMNTGALQQHVYLNNHRPFERPVIVGSEWVSFSALVTCRHLGIKPIAMIEETACVAAPWPGSLVSRLAFGVPVHTGTHIVAINGRSRVEAVEIEKSGKRRALACDGVIFTGRFRPENALYMSGLLESDGLSPRIDDNFRCTDPAYFAAGNILLPLKSSGRCWLDGKAAAMAIAGSLK